jgi:TatD DNase family protein
VYVDSHCHIDRYPHPEAVLRAAARSQVVTIAVTDTPSSFKRSSSMVQPGSLLRVAVGVHPLGASRTSEHDLNLFARLLDQTDYVGEIGLDYSIHGRPTRRRQTEIFERILAAPSIREKVLTVHSRQAEADTVRLLAEARVHAILHWYQGALKHLDAALDAGMLFSVNTSMLSTRHGQQIIAALPPERVLTETDGPYTEHDGRPNEPRHVPVLVAALASLWNEDHGVVRDRLFENMATLHARATGAPDENAIGQNDGALLDGSVIRSSNPPPFGARQISLFAECRQATRGAAPTDAELRGAS